MQIFELDRRPIGHNTPTVDLKDAIGSFRNVSRSMKLSLGEKRGHRVRADVPTCHLIVKTYSFDPFREVNSQI